MVVFVFLMVFCILLLNANDFKTALRRKDGHQPCTHFEVFWAYFYFPLGLTTVALLQPSGNFEKDPFQPAKIYIVT